MRTHVQVIGWLNIVLGILSVIGGGIIFLAITIPGLFTDIRALPWFALAGGFLASFAVISGLISLAVGRGLLNYAPWARIAAIVLSILHLVNATTMGLSTILGIYSLVILFVPETGRLFEDRSY